MDLHELSPVDRRAAGGRDGRWFERFAEVCQILPDRARIGDECDQPDVTAAPALRLDEESDGEAVNYTASCQAEGEKAVGLPQWGKPWIVPR